MPHTQPLGHPSYYQGPGPAAKRRRKADASVPPPGEEGWDAYAKGLTERQLYKLGGKVLQVRQGRDARLSCIEPVGASV